jgi:hypothetical protein
VSTWDESVDGPEPGSGGDLRDKLEQANANADAIAAEKDGENEALRRELAFARAGVDTTTDEGAFFARGYDGELEVDAIAAMAAKMNLTSAPAEQEQKDGPDLEPSEAALLTTSQTLGGTPPPADPVAADPFKEAARIHQQAVEDGESNPEAIGYAFNSLVNAAAHGDQRVIIPPAGS